MMPGCVLCVRAGLLEQASMGVYAALGGRALVLAQRVSLTPTQTNNAGQQE